MAGDDSNDCLRIVETRPGVGTGDSYYRTNDGRWWHTARGVFADETAPSERRYVHNNSLCRRR